jgi:HSP20 family protein
MAILRFDPFRDPFQDLDRLTNELRSGTRMPHGMPMDVYKRDNAWHVEMDLPVVDPASIDLTVERNELTVRAARTSGSENAEEIAVAERPHGEFTRQLVLGEGLDTNNVQASYDAGVLHLTIPLAQQAQPRRVSISRGEGGQRVIEAGGEGEQPAAH